MVKVTVDIAIYHHDANIFFVIKNAFYRHSLFLFLATIISDCSPGKTECLYPAVRKDQSEARLLHILHVCVT